MGSGGNYVAYQTAKELGFMYVDREILRRAANRLGTDRRVLEAQEEKSAGLIDNILRVFSFGTPEAYSIPTSPPLYDKDLFDAESRIIREIAGGHDAVIVGRGGFHVLKDLPGSVHVLIHAPVQFRAERIMKVKSMTRIAEARALVEESDRTRAKFVKDMCRTEWTDARHYDLCIDSSAAGLPLCIGTIVEFVKKTRGQ
jgi:cytidylate kinase